MEKIIRWFVNNKVVSNLLMMLIIITGATTIPLLKMEVFPEIDLNIINVSAVYPGASPSDVEEAIRFVTIKSNFYSQLNEYYEIFSETWKEEHKFDDDYDE